jgi:hypothetical protein
VTSIYIKMYRPQNYKIDSFSNKKTVSA